MSKPNSGDTGCSNINESTGKLAWTVSFVGGATQSKTVNFTKVKTQDETLYIFESFDRSDHVLMSVCNAKGKTNTAYGSFSIVLPENYTQTQLKEITDIISSLSF